MTGTLYIVATPIGNLEDFTFRALRILKEVDYILAEDTRKTCILLRHYEIDRPVISYHQHSQEDKKLQILNYLNSGRNLAEVSDAGTPGISDPGNELIDFLLEANPEIKIVPVPGPSALPCALSICGFDVSKFIFLGFLPKKKKLKLYDFLKESKMAFCFYESPKRTLKTLNEIRTVFGEDVRVSIGRELTKRFETRLRGSVAKVIKEVASGDQRGEVTVVVERKRLKTTD